MDRPTARVDPRVIRALVAADVRAHTRWLKWPVVVFGVVGPLAIAGTVRDDHLLGAMLAYANCLIAGYACIAFFRGQWLPGAIPLLFLPFTTLAWAFAPLFFAIFVPDHSYPLMGRRPVPHLYRFAHYEFVYMVFLVCYLAVLWPFMQSTRNSFRGSQYTSNARALAYAAAGLMVGIMAFHATAKVTHVSTALEYLAEGLFKYYRALLLVVGAFYLRINRITRYGLIMILLAFAAFYTVASTREYAAFPLVSLVMGILFFSDMRPNLKVALIGAMIVALPVYMLVGEAARRVSERGIGFESIERRAMIFQAKTGTYVERANPFIATMNRFFVTGGHSVVTRTPEHIPYYPFNPAKYVREMAYSLVPGRQLRHMEYSTNEHLIRYGFYITDETAVGVSLLGHFWMFGGMPFVILGGVVVGLFHGGLVLFLKRMWAHSAAKALIFISVLALSIFWARGTDFITSWRNIVWRIAFAYFTYMLYRLLAGRLTRATRPEDTYPGYRPPPRQPATAAAVGQQAAAWRPAGPLPRPGASG